MRLIWTLRAINDLRSARSFIEQDSPSAAAQQIEYVLAAVETLRLFPLSGRPGRIPKVRELVVGRTPFVVAYRARPELIEVLSVMHGRQSWPDAF
jgi:addiction module RelE/StbE family toxin